MAFEETTRRAFLSTSGLDYEAWHGHKLDRKTLTMLQELA